jgi:general secretion pathway protein G
MQKRISKILTRDSGFTFIELMVVIVILGVLALVIAPNFMDAPDEARQKKARMDLVSLESALKLYKLDNGVYPDTEQGIQALVEPPESGVLPKHWRSGGYLEKRVVPKDPWGNEFIYLSPGSHGNYDILSYGSDGVAGGEGTAKDINSWELA